MILPGPHGRGVRLTDSQRLHWLRLIRSENVGPATFRDLINHFGSAEAALDALPELSRRGGARRGIRICSEADARRELDAMAALGARFIGLGEPEYPPLLRAIDAPPPLLSVRGDVEVLKRPLIAIVGSRNCSIAGRKMAARLARGLAEAGCSVVSGFARGIDSAAHEASLDAGTVAVFAGGLTHVYPPENAALLDRLLASGGAVISEMPLRWEPRGRDFPRRNRLISGVALGLVVIEAARRSGSLITARMALEQNRQVFAVPGSPLDPRAAGANGLIKKGALLVTEAEDVVSVLAPLSGDLFQAPPGSDAEEAPADHHEPEAMPEPTDPDQADRHAVIDALGPTPVEIDDIIRHTGISPQAVYLIMVELDLAGRLERHPGGSVSLIS